MYVAIRILTSLILVFVGFTAAYSLPHCTKNNTAFCADPAQGVSKSNIIFRCYKDHGPVQPGNCNDNLAGVPPIGVKLGAVCWESSPKAGDAQCTFNCVKVKALNGSSFYPLGCNRTLFSSSVPSYSSSSSMKYFNTSTPTGGPTGGPTGRSTTRLTTHITTPLTIISTGRPTIPPTPPNSESTLPPTAPSTPPISQSSSPPTASSGATPPNRIERIGIWQMLAIVGGALAF